MASTTKQEYWALGNSTFFRFGTIDLKGEKARTFNKGEFFSQ